MRNLWAVACIIGLLTGCSPSKSPAARTEQLIESSQPEADWALQVDLYRSLTAKDLVHCYGDERLEVCHVSGENTGLRSADVWSDCSSDQFECVANISDTFAVPKGELSAGLKYSTYGNHFVVEKCFGARFGMSGCEVALISGKCVDKCGCPAGLAWTNPGVFFYYAKGVGVTAFFAATDVTSMRSIVPESSWMLIADPGFLAKPLRLSKSPDERPCG